MVRFSRELSCAVLLVLAGCGDRGPAAGDLKRSLAEELPVPWKIESLQIEASENTGNEAEPIYKSRIRVALSAAEDRYSVHRGYGSARVIAHVVEKGKREELFGYAESRLSSDGWTTGFSFDRPYPGTGQPRSEISGDPVLVEGTEEATRWVSAWLANFRGPYEKLRAGVPARGLIRVNQLESPAEFNIVQTAPGYVRAQILYPNGDILLLAGEYHDVETSVRMNMYPLERTRTGRGTSLMPSALDLSLSDDGRRLSGRAGFGIFSGTAEFDL